jgi:hypothetical protein
MDELSVMDNKFKVYCTDQAGKGHSRSLPPGAMPIAFPTEAEALNFAFRALWHDRIVWRIEYPDGFIVTREDIEFVFHRHPAGDPPPSLHRISGGKPTVH